VCEKKGAQITQAHDDLLLRHVYPSWLDDEGQPSSQAFYPWREVDEGCLSVNRATVTTPEDSFLLFTGERPEGFGGTSAGVWAIALGEVSPSASRRGKTQ
jgi:hypothetical protein